MRAFLYLKDKYYVEKYFRVAVGLVFGNAGIMLLHKLQAMYPLPEVMDQNNLIMLMETAPLGALYMVILAHLGGALLGGLGTSIVSNNINTAYIVGGLFTIFGIINLTMLPHPWWMWIEVLFYAPASYLGFKIIRK